MKLAFALLLTTSTLGAGSTVLAAGQGLLLTPGASLVYPRAPDAYLTLIDDDGDEGGWFWSLSDDDDCEKEGDDEGEEESDDCATGATGNAAKAGTVAPPKNGLFANGTAPVVQSN